MNATPGSVVTKVRLGWTSIIGYIVMVGGALPIVVKTIEEGRVVFGGPEKWLAILSVVVGGLTQLIRGLQAKAKIEAHAANPSIGPTA